MILQTENNKHMRLTEKQAAMVHDNHNLIYGFAKCNHLNLDEWYDILAIGLCVAAINYTPNKSAFTTFAYRNMNNAVAEHMDYCARQKRMPEEPNVSYNSKNSECENEFLDGLAASTDVEKEGLSRVWLDDFLNSLNELERAVAEYLGLGFSVSETSRMLGCSRAKISHIKKKLKTKILRKQIIRV